MVFEILITGVITVVNLLAYALIIFLLWQLLVKKRSLIELYHRYFKG